MFLGAMIIGPAAAYLVKLFDGLIEGKIRRGSRCWSTTCSGRHHRRRDGDLRQWAIGPTALVRRARTKAASSGLIDNHGSAGVGAGEPAKGFPQHAINPGVRPLGVAEAKEAGKSILFMIETNPRAGLGCWWRSGSSARAALRPRAGMR